MSSVHQNALSPTTYECAIHDTIVRLDYDQMTNTWTVEEGSLHNLRLLKPLSKINLYSVVKKLNADQLKRLIEKNVDLKKIENKNQMDDMSTSFRVPQQNINNRIKLQDEMKKISALYENSIAYAKKCKPPNMSNVMNVFNQKEIFELISQQYISIYEMCMNQSNKLYVENNIYNWKIHLYDTGSTKLNKQIKSMNGMKYIEISINILPHLFPYVSPSVSITYPLFKNDLSYRIANSKFTQYEYWNPSRSLNQVVRRTIERINKYGEIAYTDDLLITKNMINLNNLIYRLSSIDIHQEDPIDDDHQSLRFNPTGEPIILHNMSESKISIDGSPSGTGYGHHGASKWNVDEFNRLKEEREYQLTRIFTELNNLVQKIGRYTDDSDSSYEHKHLYKVFKESCIIKYMVDRLSRTTMLDINENHKFYVEIFILIDRLVSDKIGELFYINCDPMINIYTVFRELSRKAEQSLKLDLLSEHSSVNSMIISIHETMTNLLKGNENKIVNIFEEKSPKMVNDQMDFKEQYKQTMEKFKWITADQINSNYHYKKDISASAFSMRGCMKRLIAETPSLADSLSIEWDAMVLQCTEKKNINCMRFLVTGPKDTPYENGIFIFDAFMPANYPTDSPKFHFMNPGGYRLNPNLYADGKVCLSLLGTYVGPKPDESEKWIPKISTLYQVIISIQSQILVEKPYFNEPGYFPLMGTPEGEKKSDEENERIRMMTMRSTILDLLETPDTFPEFKEVIQQYFKFKRRMIRNQLLHWIEICKSSIIKEHMRTLYNRINVLLSAL